MPKNGSSDALHSDHVYPLTEDALRTVVGHVPDAPLVEWPREGGRESLQQFVRTFQDRFDPAEKLLLLCRSGVRSHYAAELLAQAGFTNAYNVLEGFEGEHGLGANGWRAAGLPWKKG